MPFSAPLPLGIFGSSRLFFGRAPQPSDKKVRAKQRAHHGSRQVRLRNLLEYDLSGKYLSSL